MRGRVCISIELWLEKSHVIADTARIQHWLNFRSTPLRDTLRDTLRLTLNAFDAELRHPLKVVMDPDALWELAHVPAHP